jgi:hypothetical protein
MAERREAGRLKELWRDSAERVESVTGHGWALSWLLPG